MEIRDVIKFRTFSTTDALVNLCIIEAQILVKVLIFVVLLTIQNMCHSLIRFKVLHLREYRDFCQNLCLNEILLQLA